MYCMCPCMERALPEYHYGEVRLQTVHDLVHVKIKARDQEDLRWDWDYDALWAGIVVCSRMISYAVRAGIRRTCGVLMSYVHSVRSARTPCERRTPPSFSPCCACRYHITMSYSKNVH